MNEIERLSRLPAGYVVTDADLAMVMRRITLIAQDLGRLSRSGLTSEQLGIMRRALDRAGEIVSLLSADSLARYPAK